MLDSLETERSLLGCCLVTNKQLPYIVATVKPNDFSSPQHKHIFEAIKKLYNSGLDVDIVTVSDALEKSNKLDVSGGRTYINDIALEIVTTVNYKSYVKIILDCSKRRQFLALAHEALDCAGSVEDIDKAIVNFNASATQILTRADQDAVPHVAEGALEVYQDLERMFESGEPLGLQTSYEKFNSMIGGFQGGKLYILAARASMGKTAFALNLGEFIARTHNVLFFSLEMQRKELAKRIMLKTSGTNSYLLQKGLVDVNILTKMTESLSSVSDLNMFVDDRTPCTPNKVELGILNMINHKGSCDLVIIDYLQLMDPDSKAKDRQAAISEISRKLKQLSNKYNVPIIALSQLSRALETREDKRPMLSDLRESGAIEQDADVVIFVYRDEYYNPDKFESKGRAEIIIAKQRDGERGTLPFIFNGGKSEFTEMRGF